MPDAGRTRRAPIPFSRQTRSNSTSGGRERVSRPVNCLPLSVSTSAGTPWIRTVCTNASATALLEGTASTSATTMNREWSCTRARRRGGSRRPGRAATDASSSRAATASNCADAADPASARGHCDFRIRWTVARDGTASVPARSIWSDSSGADVMPSASPRNRPQLLRLPRVDRLPGDPGTAGRAP